MSSEELTSRVSLAHHLEQLRLATRERGHECTHTTVTRVFDPDNITVCPRCRSPLGYRSIFVCSEDQNRLLSDHQIHELQETDPPGTHRAPTPENFELNKWMSNALANDHYTAQEADTVIAQRADVLKAIRNETLRKQHGAENRARIANKYASTMFGLDPPQESNGTVRETPVIPPCQLQFCQRCQRAGSDRAWLSLNKICDGTYAATKEPDDAQLRSIYDIPSDQISRVSQASHGKSRDIDIEKEMEKEADNKTKYDDPDPNDLLAKLEPISPAAPPCSEEEGSGDETPPPYFRKVRAESHPKTAYLHRLALHESLWRQECLLNEENPLSPAKERHSHKIRRPRLRRRPKWSNETKRDLNFKGIGNARAASARQTPRSLSIY
ncbi:hypothetical protein FQN57_003730 [Myotisia sp. PD_48]|nr:hypothetical protein FQN57_003730 [Myotisia sp. PD_48]